VFKVKLKYNYCFFNNTINSDSWTGSRGEIGGIIPESVQGDWEKHKRHAEMLLAWPRIHPGPIKYEDVVFTSPTPNSVWLQSHKLCRIGFLLQALEI